MNKSILLGKYEKLFESLKKIIEESQDRVICDNPDDLFLGNVNFFVKAYLINICTYLEAYLQDISYMYTQILDDKIAKATIPKNYVLWKTQKDIKTKDQEFIYFKIETSKKDIAETLSGNPYKTINLFKNIGVRLDDEEDFARCKNLVNTVVTKRNNIIHHNDKAMDISFSDLFHYIDMFVVYMRSIDRSIQKNIEA